MSRPDYVPEAAIDITDHGAVASTTDSHSTAEANENAIQRACDAAGDGGAIYVPSGTYYYGHSRTSGVIESGQREPSGMSVYGDGAAHSTLRMSAEYDDWHDGGGGVEYRVRDDPVDHGSVVWHGIDFDGNWTNIPHAGDGRSVVGFLLRDDIDIDLTIEQCYFHHWYAESMRLRPESWDHCSFTCNRSTFEENGAGRNADDGGAGHHMDLSPWNDGAGSFAVTNSKFVNTSGTAINFRHGTGTYTVENCWIEGTGDGVSKLSNGFRGTVEYSHIYHRAANTFTRDVLDGKPGRYFVYDLSGEHDRTIVLNHIETRDLGIYFLRATGEGNTVTVRGGNEGPIAVFNAATASDRSEVVRANDSATLHFDDFQDLSIHHPDGSSSDDLFDAPQATGLIENLRWNEYDGIGDTGNLTFGTEEYGGEPFQPVVPSEDGVGFGTSEERSSEPEDDQEDESDDEQEESPPLFDDWTPMWESSRSDWTVEADSSFGGEYGLIFESTDGERSRQAITWDSVGEPNDVEVLDKVRIPAFTQVEGNGYYARLHLRSGTSNGHETGYWLEFERPEGGFRLGKYRPDGQLTTLGRFGTIEADTFYFRRFRAEGTTLKVKTWPVEATEPTDWEFEVEDNEFESGWVGLGSYDLERVETDGMSVATGGETAPTPESLQTTTIRWISPDDGETVHGEVPITVDVRSSTSQVTVEYATAETDWTTLSYNESTDVYEGTWDVSGLASGTYTLTARVLEDGTAVASETIDVTVDNDISIESVGADVDGQTAMLRGELTSLPDDETVSVFFEWKETEETGWHATDHQQLDTTDTFSAEVRDLEADTSYDWRAVAEATERTTGSVRSFLTEPDDGGSESAEPRITRFAVEDQSGGGWTRFEVDWEVAHDDGALDTVVTALLRHGMPVVSESSSVSGEVDAYTHILRVRGAVDEVQISVNDVENNVTSETQQVG